VGGYLKLNCFAPPSAPASFASICLPQPTVSVGNGMIECTNRRGNLGRNSVVGPPLKNFDFSLFKNIPVKRVSEVFNIQFRMEAFNVFNHANFAPPLNHLGVLTQDSSGNLVPLAGGQLDTTVTNSRQIQFGLKLVW
jgi:hypothetical protein